MPDFWYVIKFENGDLLVPTAFVNLESWVEMVMAIDSPEADVICGCSHERLCPLMPRKIYVGKELVPIN